MHGMRTAAARGMCAAAVLAIASVSVARTAPPPSPAPSAARGITRLTPAEEAEFRDWYREMAAINRLCPDPDDPRHYYDYRGYWKECRPTRGSHGTLTEHGDYRFPDRYKLPGHPNPPVGDGR